LLLLFVGKQVVYLFHWTLAAAALVFGMLKGLIATGEYMKKARQTKTLLSPFHRFCRAFQTGELLFTSFRQSN
jgi:hypothetical protein